MTDELFILPDTEFMEQQGITVLVADDSDLVRRNIVKLLEGCPVIRQIIHSHSVYSTIQKMEVEQPDAVILDLQLPDGSGFDLLEYIRLKPQHVLVIVLTNFPDPGNRERALKLGADFFLDKSFEYEQLPDLLVQGTTYQSGGRA